MINVRRGFVDIEDGQVHFRTAGEGEPPLVMFHRSPSSSLSLEPLIARIAKTRRVVAPDTLGNGHSSPPAAANPDLLYFAGAHLRALNALGIERFDAYGAHTGSKIALELALAHPERVRKVIFDGISLRAPEAAAELLSGIEEVDVDHDGSQLMRAWHMVRDAYLFFPWWKHTADACRDLGLPDPVSLHGEVVDLLASIRTYHLAYRAALVHSNEEAPAPAHGAGACCVRRERSALPRDRRGGGARSRCEEGSAAFKERSERPRRGGSGLRRIPRFVKRRKLTCPLNRIQLLS